jgi:preprotein translocase subunit SecA
MRKLEHWLLLETIDFHWREHLTAIDDVRQSIGLQAYAQLDPLVAFKREGYDMFLQLQANIRKQVARTIFKVKLAEPPPPQPAPSVTTSAGGSQTENTTSASPAGAPEGVRAAPVLAASTAPAANALRTNLGEEGSAPAKAKPATNGASPKLGRNDPCYCGSGKKFKKCHGAVA